MIYVLFTHFNKNNSLVTLHCNCAALHSFTGLQEGTFYWQILTISAFTDKPFFSCIQVILII